MLWACVLGTAGCGPDDPFEGALEAVAVSSGTSHACAVLPDRRVACWGRNASNALGLPPDAELVENQTDRPLLVRDEVFPADEVQCGISQSCVMASAGLWCWGRVTPRGRLETDLDIVSPAVGARPSLCARTAAGEAWCWGPMAPPVEAEGGDEPEDPWQDIGWEAPVLIEGVTDVLVVGVGMDHACALERSGSLKCWGRRLDLDVPPWQHEETEWEPYELGHIDRPAGLTMAWDGGCAWSEDGHGWCFGANQRGQVGDGTTEYRGELVRVEGLSNIVQMSTASVAYGGHTCALLGDGGVQCWGNNGSGQLGDGEKGSFIAPTPWPVRDLPPARFVAVGNGTSFAILEDGRVAAWGSNSNGKLGTGTSSTVPIPVLPLEP